MFKIVDERRVCQESWIHVTLKKNKSINREIHTVQEEPRMDANKDGAIEMT